MRYVAVLIFMVSTGRGGLYAQSPPIITPVTFQTPASVPVGTLDSSGFLSIQGALSTQTTAFATPTPGMIELYGTGASANSINLQAPSTITSSLTWLLPSGTPAAGSLLSFSAPASGISTLGYTTITGGGGINITAGAGTLNVGIGSALTDSNGDALLAFQAGVAGSASHLQISNSNSNMPQLTAVGGSPTTSLDLSDTAGGGVNLVSNGSTALHAANAATGNTEYATVTGAASGSPVVVGASDGGTDAVNLELQPQGAGSVISASNLDTQSNALFAEIPVNPSGSGVLLQTLVILTGSGSTKGADSYPTGGTAPSHGIIGVAVNTVTAAAGNIANVAYSGVVVCTFDSGGVTFNHYVTAGAYGQCHDSTDSLTGAPPTAQVIGISLGGITGHGPAPILLRLGN